MKRVEDGVETSSSPPRRWLVLGAGGAGKSRFALELGALLDLPVVHLDRHFWQPNWVEPARDEWHAAVERLAARDAWVMDGNYSGSLTLRLPRAEVAILLDPPVWQCLYGIFRRSWSGEPRADLPEGCDEQTPDPEFVRYVATYRWRSRPKVIERISAAEHVRFHHLRSRAEARRFLDRVAALEGRS